MNWTAKTREVIKLLIVLKYHSGVCSEELLSITLYRMSKRHIQFGCINKIIIKEFNYSQSRTNIIPKVVISLLVLTWNSR